MVDIKVDFYRVTVSGDDGLEFHDVVERVNRSPNDETRNFTIGGTPVRLNNISSTGPGFCAEMVKIRMDNLPAKASLDGNLDDFDLEDNEGIGEETVFFYNPLIKTIVIQRNRIGVSAAQVAYYFATKGNIEGYVHFDPILELDTMQKLNQTEIFTKLAVRVAGGQNASIFADLPSGVGSTVAMINLLEAPYMYMEFSMGHNGGSLSPNRIKTLAKRLLRISGENPDAVKKLRISGKEDSDTSTNMIDLLEDKISETISVETSNRRLTYETRKAAVIEAWHRRRQELIEMYGDDDN